METQAELPVYQCHKRVWALKIKGIIQERRIDGDCWIIPENEKYGHIKVSHEYMAKHNPQAGGYYIVYKDGYKSYSPAEAFEGGYTLVSNV